MKVHALVSQKVRWVGSGAMRVAGLRSLGLRELLYGSRVALYNEVVDNVGQ